MGDGPGGVVGHLAPALRVNVEVESGKGRKGKGAHVERWLMGEPGIADFMWPSQPPVAAVSVEPNSICDIIWDRIIYRARENT